MGQQGHPHYTIQPTAWTSAQQWGVPILQLYVCCGTGELAGEAAAKTAKKRRAAFTVKPESRAAASILFCLSSMGGGRSGTVVDEVALTLLATPGSLLL